jgi:hypothetical protein
MSLEAGAWRLRHAQLLFHLRSFHERELDTMNVKQRQALERSIIRRLVKDVLAADHTISVYDGDDVTVTRSRNARAIMAAVMTTDLDWLFIHDAGGKKLGTVSLVYGNDGWDVISDYSVSLEGLLTGVNAYAEALEAKHS